MTASAARYTKNTQNTSTWDEAKISVVRSMWADGKTATEIRHELNAQFGAKFTRNAIVGKIHRLALPKRENDRLQSRQRRHKRDNTFGTFKRIGIEKKPKLSLLELAGEDLKIPLEQRKQFLQLCNGDCKWPVGTVGEGDFFFCGAVAIDGQSYCKTHHERAYRRDT